MTAINLAAPKAARDEVGEEAEWGEGAEVGEEAEWGERHLDIEQETSCPLIWCCNLLVRPFNSASFFRYCSHCDNGNTILFRGTRSLCCP